MFSRIRTIVIIAALTALLASTNGVAQVRCRCECERLAHGRVLCRKVCYPPRVASPGRVYLPPEGYYPPPPVPDYAPAPRYLPPEPRLLAPPPRYVPPAPPQPYVAPPPAVASGDPPSWALWMMVLGVVGAVLLLGSHARYVVRLRNETAEIDRRAREIAPLRARLEATAAEADEFVDRERRRAYRGGREWG